MRCDERELVARRVAFDDFFERGTPRLDDLRGITAVDEIIVKSTEPSLDHVEEGVVSMLFVSVFWVWVVRHDDVFFHDGFILSR